MKKFNKDILSRTLSREFEIGAPQLQLWDSVYNKDGEELVVIEITLHHGVNYEAPTWSYRAVPAEGIEIWEGGYVHAPYRVFIRGDEIGRNIFTSEMIAERDVVA